MLHLSWRNAREEVEEMVSYAGALVLNIGTLSDTWIESMLKAGKKSDSHSYPDYPGSGRLGCHRFSNQQCENPVGRNRRQYYPRQQLGNSLARRSGLNDQGGGCDAHGRRCGRDRHATCPGPRHDPGDNGPVDLITDGTRVLRVENGDAMMPYVTGTGCAATAVIGAFAAVEKNMVDAAAGGLAFIGLAGEKAAETSSGPGSFMIALLDALYTLTPDELRSRCRIAEQ